MGSGARVNGVIQSLGEKDPGVGQELPGVVT